METNNIVSIIIPCYNQAQYLEESVQSALDQTYEHIEIIIVNDGSTDHTEMVARQFTEQFPDKVKLISKTNAGLAEARNSGIEASSGEYILPLDADDRIHPEMIERSLTLLKKQNVDIISTKAQCFGAKEDIYTPIAFPECNPTYRNCWIGTSLYKYQVWEKTGGYKKNMTGGFEDWEFWINAFKHGYRSFILPEPLFYYRIKETSMYTNAMQKGAYLKSKIILNHPELYTIKEFQHAVLQIKDTESLADYYFYSHNLENLNQDQLTEVLAHYLLSNTLQDRQVIPLDTEDRDICLYNIESVHNMSQINHLLQDENAKDSFITLFYAPFHYKIPTLEIMDFSWDTEKGMIPPSGNIFTYVFKDERENIYTQLMAHQNLERYCETEKTMLNGLIGRQKTTIDQNTRSLKELRNKHDLLIKKYDSIMSRYDALIVTISKITQESLWKSPLKKTRAYKNLISLYYRYK